MNSRTTQIKNNSYEDPLTQRYVLQGLIDKGSEGIVYSILHKKSGQLLACKKIEIGESRINGLRVLQEIRLLKYLNHENIIHLEEYLYAQIESVNTVFLIYELFPRNLSESIKSGRITASTQMKYIISQLASSLYYLHINNFIHRDVKPSNILINDRFKIKLCDFGSCKCLNQKESYPTIQSVCTKIYMPPEYFYEGVEETTTIDIWQLGCVYIQMILRAPPFKGHSVNSIKKSILSLIKPDEIIKFNNNEEVNESYGLKETKTILPYFFRTLKIDSSSQELIYDMLQIDPLKRITAIEILQHQSVAMFKQPLGEKESNEFEFVKGNETYDEIVQLIKNEM
ncbi:mitogen-activated protein kinase, putative [Entamoeba dispar SAW760]|uniref:Mitogen-activated protein kinase, putative n=1 Tax=Entamoeba dispar (strain ATCC PRA-260 / SAW760) TaxID=370354 RepID=B0EVB3_ENTDS|nr:mitogen-activated protein kinase, putative [Entamoeba dispar SAW760]EDR21525.1 mitogen-activated protein kinase, putative [Entamoeba dispar SAW760]|eukprot:EDR21525.1 mitogen-activated protein kinase, putative [Entamoeba dispar SAW760]